MDSNVVKDGLVVVFVELTFLAFIWNRNLLSHYKCLYCHFWSNECVLAE